MFYRCISAIYRYDGFELSDRPLRCFESVKNLSDLISNQKKTFLPTLLASAKSFLETSVCSVHDGLVESSTLASIFTDSCE